MNLRHLLYGIQILLGLALAIAGYVEDNTLTIVAWSVVAIVGAILLWNDSGEPLEV
ncbi:hypothetical protein SAMN04487947_0450 [Halogeometricum rufum]|uniref:Uncharacterized protein n=1 Tax=Halogeometricum rufum TaxID=553469 RepID=A0A1I6G2C7_9EURY|nr:hypothetical protein [Halogeometricum rufum]SFR36338.1 hypothetical protein SAMN04487947_0450 [Halogeometricum rufum]